MSQIASAGNSFAPQSNREAKNALAGLDMNQFLDLMIAELQNQDPLNPLENDQLLAQIGQIREIGSTDNLTSTLDSVLLGQNISSATNLIGAEVEALTDSGERVTGSVRRVTIDGKTPQLDIAVSPGAEAGETEGGVRAGKYTYEVVWDGPKGEEFSFTLPVDTETLTDFKGSLKIKNLPETDGEKRVYRTDATGEGDRKLVATLPSGKITSFLDTVADQFRQATLTTTPQQLGVARRVTVTLNNISQIEPPPK